MIRLSIAILLATCTTSALAEEISDTNSRRNASGSAPQNSIYRDKMTLSIDATDLDRGIFKVVQNIPVAKNGAVTLLFPKWLPGNHAPRGEIEKLTGLVFKAGGKTLEWKRDPIDVYAFHITLPANATSVEARFQFTSATAENQGRIVMTQEMLNLQWNNMSLYPAGFATHSIPVTATVKYPTGWKAATALRTAKISGDSVEYQTVDYETLIDSPVFAGKYFRSEPLGGNVTLNIVADAAKYLVIKPEQLAAHSRLVTQATKLFGTRQFDHYDFLLSMTDTMSSIGLEHHRSSENGVNPEYFTEWDSGPGERNLLPHELTHSWNGKHRRPAGQMVTDYRTPLVDDLLWVYEGQTQFWGYVLGARSGLYSKQDTLDALATIAAGLDSRRGRDWRSLDDTTNDPVISARRPKGWASWQRSEDYYNEGLLIWLEADAIIRAQTAGAKSLDDFARAFFGTKEGDFSAKPYTIDDIVSTFDAITPYRWRAFFDERLTEKAAGAPLNGLTQGGYRLIYTDVPTPYFKDVEKQTKSINLTYSIGATISKMKLTSVLWDGPLFNAGLTTDTELIAVNGKTYSDDAIKDTITAAKGGKEPIRLIVKNGDRVREVSVSYFGGLRYPRLERTNVADGGIDLLLRARP